MFDDGRKRRIAIAHGKKYIHRSIIYPEKFLKLLMERLAQIKKRGTFFCQY